MYGNITSSKQLTFVNHCKVADFGDDRKGRTILHMCCEEGLDELVEVLPLQ